MSMGMVSADRTRLEARPASLRWRGPLVNLYRSPATTVGRPGAQEPAHAAWPDGIAWRLRSRLPRLAPAGPTWGGRDRVGELPRQAIAVATSAKTSQPLVNSVAIGPAEGPGSCRGSTGHAPTRYSTQR